MYAHFTDETYKNLIILIISIHLVGKSKRELYDTRGFLSCTRILSTDQKIQSEFYYSPQKKLN